MHADGQTWVGRRYDCSKVNSYHSLVEVALRCDDLCLDTNESNRAEDAVPSGRSNGAQSGFHIPSSGGAHVTVGAA